MESCYCSIIYQIVGHYFWIVPIDRENAISITHSQAGDKQLIDVKSMIFGELKHERNFKLKISDTSIYYNYYECYHDQGNSSNPVWYYAVDTEKNKYSNYGQKGEKEVGTTLDLQLSEAKKQVFEQINASEVITDLGKIKELLELKTFVDMLEIISNLGSNKLIRKKENLLVRLLENVHHNR